MSGMIELTAYSGKFLGPIAKVLGWIMSGIYDIVLKISGGTINSVPLAIVLMTILIYMCLLPLTIQQQKFSKLSQKMQPELNAIRDKYKNRKDQEAMMAMNQETQLVYQKYGISPSGSCIQMLIQMPILFALYRVFYNIPAYISSVRSSYTGLVDGIINTNGFVDKLTALMTNFNAVTSSGLNANNVADKLNAATGTTLSNYVTDIMYKLPSTAWEKTADAGKTIFEQFPNLSDSLNSTLHDMNQFNYFLGLNISDTPWAIIKSSIASHAWLLLIIAVLIPVLSYITQVINIKLMPTAATAGGDNDQMARQMKTMNTVMPLMSLFFCFVTPVGLGIYWVASALCRAVQQFFINKHIENLDLEDIIAKNQEKVKKKREKMGVTEERIRQAAAMNTRSIQSKANVSSANIEMEREKANAAKANAKPGSMAAKANLVKEFREKNNRK